MVEACQQRPVAQMGHSRSSSGASAGMAAASRASTWPAAAGRSAGSGASRAATARSTAAGTSGLRLLAGGGGPASWGQRRPAGPSSPGLEGLGPGGQLEQDRPEREQVHARSGRKAADLLGGHPRRRPAPVAARRRLADRPGQAEVDQHRPALAQHHVARLDVQVDQARGRAGGRGRRPAACRPAARRPGGTARRRPGRRRGSGPRRTRRRDVAGAGRGGPRAAAGSRGGRSPPRPAPPGRGRPPPGRAARRAGAASPPPGTSGPRSQASQVSQRRPSPSSAQASSPGASSWPGGQLQDGSGSTVGSFRSG